MKPALAFKIIFMTATLLAILWVIRTMNVNKVEKAFDALGLQTGGTGSVGFHPAEKAPTGEAPPSPGGLERYNLCPTRIVAIEFQGGRKIEEARDGMKVKWLAVDGTPRELESLAVEKWLSLNCRIAIRTVTLESFAMINARSQMAIRYVDGKLLGMTRIGDMGFQLSDGTVFESPDLRDSFIELQRLAQFKQVSGL